MSISLLPASTTRPTPKACGPLPDGKWLIPLSEAAPMLGMSLRTARTRVANEQIPHRRNLGRVWMLWPDDVQATLDAMFVAPDEDDAA